MAITADQTSFLVGAGDLEHGIEREKVAHVVVAATAGVGTRWPSRAAEARPHRLHVGHVIPDKEPDVITRSQALQGCAADNGGTKNASKNKISREEQNSKRGGGRWEIIAKFNHGAAPAIAHLIPLRRSTFRKRGESGGCCRRRRYLPSLAPILPRAERATTPPQQVLPTGELAIPPFYGRQAKGDEGGDIL